MKFEITYILESNRFLIRTDPGESAGILITGELGCSPEYIARAIQNYVDVILNG